MRVVILGAGAWGTALGIHMARLGHAVALWDRDPERAATMAMTRHNPAHLVDAELPAGLHPTSDLAEAVTEADLLVPVVPSRALRAVVRQAVPYLPSSAWVATASKGFEDGTRATMYEVLMAEVPDPGPRCAVLTGPSFAKEVAAGLPTAVVAAGEARPAAAVAEAFHGDRFRVYTSDDVIGVSYGGSLKNVMAIAAGVADGLGLGHNAIAGIITRGLAETSRLAEARGGRSPLTLMGLAGLGDLVLTCTANLSRNRRVGLALGQGRRLPDVLTEIGEVAEGVDTARNALALAQEVGVDLPITAQVHAILDQGRHPAEALAALLGRERRAERDHPPSVGPT